MFTSNWSQPASSSRAPTNTTLIQPWVETNLWSSPNNVPSSPVKTAKEMSNTVSPAQMDEFVQVFGSASWGVSTPVQQNTFEDEGNELQNSTKTAKRKNNIEGELSVQSLYKTELCHSFEETGICRYGNKCQFAHGKAELRPVMRHPKYKTEVCKTYYTRGTCPYGKRCRFIHTTSGAVYSSLTNNAPQPTESSFVQVSGNSTSWNQASSHFVEQPDRKKNLPPASRQIPIVSPPQIETRSSPMYTTTARNIPPAANWMNSFLSPNVEDAFQLVTPADHSSQSPEKGSPSKRLSFFQAISEF